eukprot:6191657-Pleurochrysis_carterae.AAC.2
MMRSSLTSPPATHGAVARDLDRLVACAYRCAPSLGSSSSSSRARSSFGWPTSPSSQRRARAREACHLERSRFACASPATFCAASARISCDLPPQGLASQSQSHLPRAFFHSGHSSRRPILCTASSIPGHLQGAPQLVVHLHTHHFGVQVPAPVGTCYFCWGAWNLSLAVLLSPYVILVQVPAQQHPRLLPISRVHCEALIFALFLSRCFISPHLMKLKHFKFAIPTMHRDGALGGGRASNACVSLERCGATGGAFSFVTRGVGLRERWSGTGGRGGGEGVLRCEWQAASEKGGARRR